MTSFDGLEIPKRHHLLKIGSLSFYWIWINEGTERQHRCWTVCWHTRRNLIHLAHWLWWRPIILFPSALLLSWRLLRERSDLQ